MKWHERFLAGFGAHNDEGEPVPTFEVIRLLGSIEEDDTADKHERAMCKEWRSRLVDDEGNPIDRDADRLLDIIDWAAEGNALAMNGTLTTSVRYRDGSIELRYRVDKRVASLDRAEVERKCASHLSAVLPRLLEKLGATEGGESS